MIDIKKYIESGVIEEYYLGILSDDKVSQLMQLSAQHREVKVYMEAAAIANTMFFTTIQKKPPLNCLPAIQAGIQNNKLWAQAQLDNETKLLTHFIDISRHTSVEKIEAVIIELKPTAAYDNIFPTLLYGDEKRELVLVWVKDFVPLEEHPELDESFLVLQGTADCYIDEEVFHMVKGDFMRIPPECEHKVMVTSKTPAKAIRCRIAI